VGVEWAQGKSLLQINGMTPVSHVNRVAVWRPMLAHDKAAVLDFAHTYGVPYFKDTTPTWSNRGKLRNQLMPLLGVRRRTLCFSSLSREKSFLFGAG
jgi:tRNA(Ile)-lysidine synthase TilS/MesJ